MLHLFHYFLNVLIYFRETEEGGERESVCHRFVIHLFMNLLVDSFFFPAFKIFYLFLERGEGRERGRETSVCDCLSCTPHWGPGLQLRHVPWLGIEPATLWFAGPPSIHWATPTKTISRFLYVPWLEIEPPTLAYQDDALTNWVAWPGLTVFLNFCSMWLLYFLT